MNSVQRTEAEVLITMALEPMVGFLQAVAGEGSTVFAYERNIVILSKNGAHVLVRLDPAEVHPA